MLRASPGIAALASLDRAVIVANKEAGYEKRLAEVERRAGICPETRN